MTEQSDRMLMLLQELAALKELGGQSGADAAARRKRRKEIRAEMKQLAEEKKESAQA